MSKLVELSCVALGNLVARVAVREKEFGCSLNPGSEFSDLVDLAFPAAPELAEDLVLVYQSVPRLEGEFFNSVSPRAFFILHCSCACFDFPGANELEL